MPDNPLHAEVCDVTLALNSVGGDAEFLAELVGLTKAAWPTLLADLREGMSRGDLLAVKTRARLAKAAARNVSARRAFESAQHLETTAVKGDLRAAQGAIARLEQEVEMLLPFLASLEASACCA